MKTTSQTHDHRTSLATPPEGLTESFTRDSVIAAYGTDGPVLAVNPGYYSGSGASAAQLVRTPHDTDDGSAQE